MSRVSVVIPTFNRESTIERAIHSVLNQTFQDFDLWIIDDGSTDATEERVRSYLDKNIHYIKQENLGVSAARNLGIKNSKSEWLAFLDSDDEWLPNKLQLQFDYIQANPNIDLVHGEEIWIRNGKRVNQKNKYQKSGGRIFQKCLPLCAIGPSTVVIKRSLLGEMGNWNEDFEVCEDYDLWLKVTAKHEVGFIAEPLINKYGGHSDQLSAKYKAMDFWRVKSMKNLLDNESLDCEDVLALKKEILHKGEILLKGYEKHQNLENVELVKNWMESCL